MSYIAGILIQPSYTQQDKIIVNIYQPDNATPTRKLYKSDQLQEAIKFAEDMALKNNWIKTHDYNWEEKLN